MTRVDTVDNSLLLSQEENFSDSEIKSFYDNRAENYSWMHIKGYSKRKVQKKS